MQQQQQQQHEKCTARKYLNMQRLNIGKASQEGRHHLDVFLNSKTQMKTQTLHRREHHAWGHLHPSLECTQFSKVTPLATHDR
jgi:hypothetical protein